MVVQFVIGTGLILVTIVITGLAFWALESWFIGRQGWLLRRPHRPKLILAASVLALWIMLQFSLAVWTWALAFLALGIFDGLEPALYFALVAFTTLGFGDVLLPLEWRLLAGFAAANGLMHFGLVTAILVESLRQVRLGQMSAREAGE